MKSGSAHIAQPSPTSGVPPRGGRSERYKWVALSNTTLGTMMATIDTSIMLIALPDVFRGIHLDPLAAGNSFFLLWMILSFQVVTAVLVVSFGRLGDIFGRVRMYNLGFAVYTAFSLLLTLTWMSRHQAEPCGSSSCASSRASGRPFCWPTPRPSSPTPSPSTSAAWPWASTRQPASAACSSAWCWAASSAPSTGA